MSALDDLFNNPDLWKPQQQAQQPPPIKTGYGDLVDHVTNALANIGEGAVHGLPSMLGFIGDALSTPMGPLDTTNPAKLPTPQPVLPGTGAASQAADKSFKLAEDAYTHGHTPSPHNKAEKYLRDAGEGVASMLVGGGPEAALPAVVGGVVGPTAGNLTFDLTGNQDLANAVGLLGSLAGIGAHPVLNSIENARTINAGATHPDFAKLVSMVEDREGGGTFDNPKVNPKSGAMGPMQVTPETARDPGYGIRPWDGKSQQDLSRVGRQKLAALMGKYNGDTEKAFAAYNWGEGHVDAAVAKYGADWLDHAPAETQHYVEGVNGSTGGSVPPMNPEDIAAAMQDPQSAALEGLASVAHGEDIPTDAPDNVVDLGSVRSDRYRQMISDKYANLHQELDDTNSALLHQADNPNDPNALTPAELTSLRERLIGERYGFPSGRETYDKYTDVINTLDHLIGPPEDRPHLTPAEAQEMDASVPNYTPPEAVDARTVGQGADMSQPTPANDISKPANEYTDEEWARLSNEQKQNALNIENALHLKEVQPPLPSPEAVQRAKELGATSLDDFTPEQWSQIEDEVHDGGTGGGDKPPPGGGGSEPPSGGDEPPPEEPSAQTDEELTDKLATSVKNAKPIRSQQESIYTRERSKRVQASTEAGKMTSGRSGFFAEKAALGGELPKVDFEGIRDQFSPEEVDRLHDMIKENPRLTQFDKIHARDGLEKLLGAEGANDPTGSGGGAVPTHSELRLLGEVFPDNVMKALLKKRPMDERISDFILNASSMSRALRASFDFSAPFRQGFNLIGTKEWFKSFGTMFKAVSKAGFENVQNEIATRSTYPLMKKAGLALTNVGEVLDSREEMFLSKWAEKLPHVKYSERAYTAFLNKLRADTFDTMVKQSFAAGIDFRDNPKALRAIGDYINNATGRGDLGQLAQSYKLLNATFFSPRLMMSRARMFNPIFYAKLYAANPVVAKKALADWVRVGIVATTAVGVAKMAGLKVEADPRSSDFGKFQIGNTRFDPYGGYQQYVHLAAVLATGAKVSPTTGNVTDLTDGKFGHGTRFDSVMDFLRNKESPMANVIDDLLSYPKNRFGQKITAGNEAINLVVPMNEEDIRQAFQDNPDGSYHVNPQGLAAVPAATFGMGVQTFQPKAPSSSEGYASVDDILNDKTLWGPQ